MEKGDFSKKLGNTRQLKILKQDSIILIFMLRSFLKMKINHIRNLKRKCCLSNNHEYATSASATFIISVKHDN